MPGEVYPVAIVGCGPVGMTLANLLGAYGTRCVVIEAGADLADFPRAVGTDFDCLRAWQALGLDEKLLRDMVPCGPDGVGMVYRDGGGRPFLEVRPTRRDFGFALGYTFIQPLVDRELLAGLSRFPHVEVRFGHVVESVGQDAEGVDIHGSRRDGAGSFTVRARYVVACDGGRSRVRRSLGIEMRGRAGGGRWLILDTVEPDTPARSVHEVDIWCSARRPTVSVPRLHGHRRWEFLARPEETDEHLLAPQTIAALLAPHVDPDRVEVRRKVVHQFAARVAERMREDRVLLAGDAAHVTPPFAGQGMAMGIRDVFNLGWKLALVANDGAAETLLDTYEEERRDEIRATLRLARRLGRLMMPRTRLGAAATAVVLRAFGRNRAFREFFREGGPRPRVRLRPGAFSVRRAWGRAGGVMLPQPEVEDWNGRRCRLDTLLGPSFALLGFGVDPIDLLSRESLEFWAALGMHIVEIVADPSVCRSPRAAYDRDGAFSTWFGEREGRVLLVRPDRFVAADFRVGEAEQVMRLVRERLGGSMPCAVPSRRAPAWAPGRRGAALS